MYKASAVDCFKHQLHVINNEKRALLVEMAGEPSWTVRSAYLRAELDRLNKDSARIEQRWGAYLVRNDG